MEMPENGLKKALLAGRPQIGLWSSLASHISVEVIARAGFDWILLDMEHSPNELQMLHGQMQATVGGTASAVVRPQWNDAVLLKRILDLGAQTVLLPMVQDADEARRGVAATRYPPHGVRGMGSLIRANHYGRVPDYLQRVHDELCVIVQIETRTALRNIEAIAAVDGVDGLFIGPNDLAADLGYIGRSTHADVKATIDDAIERIRRTGKFAGILTGVEADARHWLERGALFVAVGSDSGLLATQADALAARFNNR